MSDSIARKFWWQPVQFVWPDCHRLQFLSADFCYPYIIWWHCLLAAAESTTTHCVEMIKARITWPSSLNLEICNLWSSNGCIPKTVGDTVEIFINNNSKLHTAFRFLPKDILLVWPWITHFLSNFGFLSKPFACRVSWNDWQHACPVHGGTFSHY